MYRFTPAAAGETIVFGSARPKFNRVTDWLAAMEERGIRGVCCLLEQRQLDRYDDLLGAYRERFGSDLVCWAPIADFSLVDPTLLADRILPFLTLANVRSTPIVVHCGGGIGRTGHVLAAWLVAGRKYPPVQAIAAVKRTGRNPHEAILAAPFMGQNSWRVARDLDLLLTALTRA
jgi:protein-tyrosine phosphatase